MHVDVAPRRDGQRAAERDGPCAVGEYQRSRGVLTIEAEPSRSARIEQTQERHGPARSLRSEVDVGADGQLGLIGRQRRPPIRERRLGRRLGEARRIGSGCHVAGHDGGGSVAAGTHQGPCREGPGFEAVAEDLPIRAGAEAPRAVARHRVAGEIGDSAGASLDPSGERVAWGQSSVRGQSRSQAGSVVADARRDARRRGRIGQREGRPVHGRRRHCLAEGRRHDAGCADT